MSELRSVFIIERQPCNFSTICSSSNVLNYPFTVIAKSLSRQHLCLEGKTPHLKQPHTQLGRPVNDLPSGQCSFYQKQLLSCIIASNNNSLNYAQTQCDIDSMPQSMSFIQT